MSVQSLLAFIKKHMLVTYLTLIPSFILVILSLSLHSRVIIFAVQLILIIMGTYVMFGEYKEEKAQEKLIEEKNFTKKLQVHLRNLMDKVGNTAYYASLTSLSISTSEDEDVRKRTEAWSIYFRRLENEFTTEADTLIKKLDNEIEFTEGFDKFRDLLSLFRIIKEKFYIMIKETKPLKDFTQDSDFQKIYKNLYDEHSRYMDKLGIFSDECEAQFNLKLDKYSIEHLKDLHQL